MWKKLKRIKTAWNLVNSIPSDLESLVPMGELQKGETVWDYYERAGRPKERRGNGGAIFMPYMTETERDEYLKNQEPKWRKFNEKLKAIIK